MSEKIPQVIFKYAYPLDRECRQRFADKIDNYPEEKEIKETVVRWRKLWREINEDNKLLKQIVELTGVHDQVDITAFVIGGGFRAKSSPLLLPVTSTRKIGKDKDKMIELIIHEILHNFVSGHKEYWGMVRERYGDEPIKTQNHIIIYALLEKILGDILPDLDLEDTIADGWDDYVRALEIARAEGSEKIIQEFRELTKGD